MCYCYFLILSRYLPTEVLLLFNFIRIYECIFQSHLLCAILVVLLILWFFLGDILLTDVVDLVIENLAFILNDMIAFE